MMKRIEFNNLPAGSIVVAKRYNLWQRFKAWLTRKPLKYNDAWIDPFGHSGFLYQDTLWTKHNVFTFTPRKQYSKKEMLKLFEQVLPNLLLVNEPVEALLMINQIRPNTFSGVTLEELLEDNKYYTKKELK